MPGLIFRLMVHLIKFNGWRESRNQASRSKQITFYHAGWRNGREAEVDRERGRENTREHPFFSNVVWYVVVGALSCDLYATPRMVIQLLCSLTESQICRCLLNQDSVHTSL